jgi:hypothetical protein
VCCRVRAIKCGIPDSRIENVLQRPSLWVRGPGRTTESRREMRSCQSQVSKEIFLFAKRDRACLRRAASPVSKLPPSFGLNHPLFVTRANVLVADRAGCPTELAEAR